MSASSQLTTTNLPGLQDGNWNDNSSISIPPKNLSILPDLFELFTHELVENEH
jgi:hypothetical protein